MGNTYLKRLIKAIKRLRLHISIEDLAYPLIFALLFGPCSHLMLPWLGES